jgi:hypothetical protein
MTHETTSLTGFVMSRKAKESERNVQCSNNRK